MQWLVGTRCDEVVRLSAVEAEPLVTTTFLLLGGETTAAKWIDLYGQDVRVQVVGERVSRDREWSALSTLEYSSKFCARNNPFDCRVLLKY